MGFLKKLRERHELKLLKKAVQAELDRIESMEEAAISLSPLLPHEGETKEMGEVTGVYRTVAAMMRDAIKEKKKGRSAAQRISDSVGVTPVPKKK